MQKVTINGIDTHYVTTGQGSRDVLFLHGWASSARMWLRSMYRLRRQYRMWAVDLPGFGASGAPQADWCTPRNYAEHVAEFCDAVGIAPCVVVGHSMGARVGFHYAYKHPKSVDRIVAISPALTGRLGFNLDLFMVAGLGPILNTLAHHMWPVATAQAMTHYFAPRHLNSEAVRRTSDDLRRSDPRATVASLQMLIRQDDTPLLTQIKQPTLVLVGDRDYTIPPEDARIAAHKLPNAHLITFPKTYHQVTDEVEDAYLDALTAFLEHETGTPYVFPSQMAVEAMQ
jgi:pimeloyl-ACP methyl ester carboxylesterase